MLPALPPREREVAIAAIASVWNIDRRFPTRILQILHRMVAEAIAW
jgi:hypothetical protein